MRRECSNHRWEQGGIGGQGKLTWFDFVAQEILFLILWFSFLRQYRLRTCLFSNAVSWSICHANAMQRATMPILKRIIYICRIEKIRGVYLCECGTNLFVSWCNFARSHGARSRNQSQQKERKRGPGKLYPDTDRQDAICRAVFGCSIITIGRASIDVHTYLHSLVVLPYTRPIDGH